MLLIGIGGTWTQCSLEPFWRLEFLARIVLNTVSGPCEVPGAELQSRFTLMFEAFAVRVLQLAVSVEQASLLMYMNWSSVRWIMGRAMEQGLLQRQLDDIKHVGLDKKSLRRCKDYVSVLTDIDGSRVNEQDPILQ